MVFFFGKPSVLKLSVYSLFVQIGMAESITTVYCSQLNMQFTEIRHVHHMHSRKDANLQVLPTFNREYRFAYAARKDGFNRK
jgi:hypothetical protein